MKGARLTSRLARSHLVLLLGLALLAAAEPASAQIPEIGEPIITAFGTYVPPEVVVVAEIDDGSEYALRAFIAPRRAAPRSPAGRLGP